MYVIKELCYGLNLSKEENKDYLDNLQSQDFEYHSDEIDSWAYFPYHGGQICFDTPSFRMGVYIDDDDSDGDLAEKLMTSMKEESKYKDTYNQFKEELLNEIEHYIIQSKDEPIGEYFTEEFKNDCLKTLDWFKNKVKNEEPTFYFSESSS